MILYKYRMLDNPKFFLDIIINNRLYAAKYTDLNDPMEGQFLYQHQIPKEVIDNIRDQKRSRGIVSLSKDKEHPLMWSHYAGGHTGVAIGVEIDEKKYKINEINYSNKTYQLDSVNITSHDKIAEDILCNKISVWDYEKEVRIFTKNNEFLPVTIKEVILGGSMDKSDKNLFKCLIEKIDPSIIISENDRKDLHRYYH